jgi:transcriptional regulator with XRE-family HTH domain
MQAKMARRGAAPDRVDERMSVGRAILRIRAAKRLSQREVGRKSRLAPSYLSRIENERIEPSIATLGRLAAALDVEVSDFFAVSKRIDDPPCTECPVSSTGDCIGTLLASGRGPRPRGGKAIYTDDDLRLLLLADYVVRHGAATTRSAMAVLLESLVNRAERSIRAPGR